MLFRSPLPVLLISSFESDCKYEVKPLLVTSLLASATVNVTVGLTFSCTQSVIVAVFLPIFVLPLYVVQVIVQVALTPFGIAFKKSFGIVQLLDVVIPVPIVTVFAPNFAVMVWVKLEAARLVLITIL